MLCETLGYPAPRYLLPLLTPLDRLEWMAYFRIRYPAPDATAGGHDDDEVLLDPSEAVGWFAAMRDNGYAVEIDDGG